MSRCRSDAHRHGDADAAAVSRQETLLPTLPLWAAALIALTTEAALLTGLTQLSSPSIVNSPQIPIEISLVAASALTDAPQIPPSPPFSKGGENSVSVSKQKEDTRAIKKRSETSPIAIAKNRKESPAKKHSVINDHNKKITAKNDINKNTNLETDTNKKSSIKKDTFKKPPLEKDANKKPPLEKGGLGGFNENREFSAATYLNNPAPSYPDTARRLRQEGTVQLRVQVSISGNASAVSIASSSGVISLDQAAVRAVQRWRFKPARRDGIAVAATVQIPIRFQLNSSIKSD
ncbi:hypothetical protein CKO09_05570 [Chromatium weissei]|nr:hypothetical protein [Chromatium weissei]